MTIDPVGAATFSSSVTATTSTFAGSGSDRVIMTRTGVGTYHLAISATNRFSIYDPAADAERISITSGGNVLIGTTTDSGYKLDVSGRIRAFTASSGVSPRTDLGGTIIAEGSTRAGLYILTTGTAAGSYGSIWWGNGNTNTDAFITVANDTRAMAFGTADGTRMTITSGGNVLIGTTTDNGHKLQLSTSSTSKTTFSINNTSANKTFEIGVQGSSGTLPNRFYIFDDDRNAFLFTITSGGTSRFHAALETIELTSESTTKLATISGNVLIGTDTDTSDKLRVNGNTYTNTIRTHTPDLETRSVAWKLGASRGGTVTTNATVRVEIDGVLVDLVARYV
jgi:hypothetical protein